MEKLETSGVFSTALRTFTNYVTPFLERLSFLKVKNICFIICLLEWKKRVTMDKKNIMRCEEKL